MTTELQRAMARYEEARIRYRKAVLSSLDGASNGDAIRAAIQEFQRANGELRRLSGAPAPVDPARARPARAVAPVPVREPLPSVWGAVRRAFAGIGARRRQPA